jgi:hypothetical protein
MLNAHFVKVPYQVDLLKLLEIDLLPVPHFEKSIANFIIEIKKSLKKGELSVCDIFKG